VLDTEHHLQNSGKFLGKGWKFCSVKTVDKLTYLLSIIFIS